MLTPELAIQLDKLPVSVSRRVRALGHALVKLWEGGQLLCRRTDKGANLGGLDAPWIANWGSQHFTSSPVLPLAVERETLIDCHEKTWSVVQPCAASLADTSIPLPWLVLLQWLRLPSLKSYWRQTLRAQRAALLQASLPWVWPLDTTTLPPGATIAGLKIAGWQSLPRLLATGKSFELVSLATGAREPINSSTSAEAWQAVLDRSQNERFLLVALSSMAEATRLHASWAKDDQGWIDLAELTLEEG